MQTLVETVNLKKEFEIGGLFSQHKALRAVDGVDLKVNKGDSVGLVGESGSGKTTLGRLILRLLTPTAGSVLYEGQEVLRLRGNELKRFRKKAQIVFQSPFLSLNPSLKVYDALAGPMLYHGVGGSKAGVFDRVVDLLKIVGLGMEHLYKYPHELSGGQTQRVAIARALALNPEFVIFDEPTSSLDVSAQAQILNLISGLKKEFDLTYVLISHNLAVVSTICNRVAVMYSGKLVELAEAGEFFSEPKHPYSQALLNSLLVPDPKMKNRERKLPKMEPPSPINPPSGCRFHPRCPFVMEVCPRKEPALLPLSQTRSVACFLYHNESAAEHNSGQAGEVRARSR